MLFEFVAWWYGRGWLDAVRTARGWVARVQAEFSAGLLLKTLFSPWKQIVSLPGRSLGEKFNAMIDNLISRVVGFGVRLFALLAAAALMVLAVMAGIIFIIFWPLMPVAIFYGLYKGIIG